MNPFSYRKYTDHVYTITERYTPTDGGSTMALVIGEKNAAIIDTGMGVTGNLRDYIGTITPLPVICLLTHPHPDHAGSAAIFDTCYLNEIDKSMLEWAVSKEKRKNQMARLCQEVSGLAEAIDAEIHDCDNLKYSPLHDGDVFDLGGMTLQALLVPGHTAGSTVFFCKESNMVFVGDAVAPMTSLIGEGPEDYVKIADYLKGLKNLRSVLNAETMVFCYHRELPLGVQVIDDMIAACEKVLSGNASKEATVLFPFLLKKQEGREYYQEVVGSAKLVYDMASV